ncbi:c-type cytochrome biogenesis protein CcmI [Oceanomicrobium pacificus]|uniref:C-type cytochrome biogenesis protein CcmI n=1 Tax=Oceanomicrobium pacificus TaxID=2692916 RepID=A0A6B0TUK9_9RHOB|nr:c-type cytochrome biogenesis protein CcmI [Oceanomicrobium pacificus]MXU65465.1 c-type cytochrome biogenesis protein CcmI [Oceanomicrobium pacificus]
MLWILSALLFLIALLAILLPLLRRRGGDAAREAYDRQVYLDQLAELDKDLDRGILSAEEAERSRAEVARRLLRADQEERKAPAGSLAQDAPRGATRIAAVAVLVLLAALSWGLYAQIGTPSLPDQPLGPRLAQLAEARENRPRQAEAEDMVAQIRGLPDDSVPDGVDPALVPLVDQLEEVLADRPDDLRGHVLLSQNLARLGRFAEARRAQQRVIEIMNEDAGAAEFSDLAEFMILAAGGYVSPEAERALAIALAQDPTLPQPRYYSGLALAQAGQTELALQLWMRLLEEGPDDAPWVQTIRSQIGDLMPGDGGPTAPTAPELAGPSGSDMEAAAEMSAGDRAAMIEGMVAGLQERLSTEGGTAAEWAQLIRAYGVLGQTRNASDAWAAAREAYVGDEAALLELRRAAQDAEVAN